jgi:hypothetical protein
MNLSPHSGRNFLRLMIVALIVTGGPIAFYFLHAQTTHSSAGGATNSPSTLSVTNETLEMPIPPSASAATNQALQMPISPAAPADQGLSNNATGTTSLSLQGATNSAAGATNAPDIMEGPGAVSEGPGPAEPNLPTPQPEPEGVSEEAPGAPANPAVQPVTNLGFWDSLWARGSPLHFGLDVGEMYDDNILISPRKTSSFLTHISPSLDFQKGDQTAPHMNYLNAYFAPTFFLYEPHSEDNRVDYDADLYYQYNFTRLSIGIEQHYQRLTDATIDVGSLVKRDIYTTEVNANYVYNDDLGIYGSATQQISNYPNVTFNEWTAEAYALYQILPKVQVGAGPRVTFLDIGGAPNETHEDLLLRLKYLPQEKLSLGCNVGGEYLQYQDNEPSHILPIFDFDVGYALFDGTYLYAVAGRESTSSYDILGETIATTQVQLGVSQRFLQNFRFTLSLGYTMADYEFGTASDSATEGRRKDNYYLAKGALQWDPNNWFTGEVSYQYSDNHSNFEGNSFSDNQVDIQATFHF